MEALSARVTLDELGTVTGWNDGAERLLGYPAEEIVGRPAVLLLAERPVPQELPPSAGPPRWHGTLTLLHRSGRRLVARVLAHHRTAEDGSRDWLLVSAVAGTPRPEDDALMRRGLMQSPSCATSVYDTDLRYRRSSRAAQHALGLGEEELRGLRTTDVIPTPVSEAVERRMRLALETGEPQYVENHARAPGEDREHAWSVQLYRVEDPDDGRVLGVAATGHDVTEQYWARKRLQLIAAASSRIGSTLDVTRTAQELADVAVPDLADFLTVDLLTSFEEGGGAWGAGGAGVGTEGGGAGAGAAAGAPLALRRVAHQSVLPGVPEAVLALGDVDAYPEGSPPVESLRSGRGLYRRVFPAALPPWVADDPQRTARIRDFGFHSVMAVPLSARGTTLGVVVLARHRRPDPFEDDDLVLAEELAARAAVCIDNARRYTRARGTAVTLQRSLLPQRLPEQSAVEVASRYLPAGARAGVGGDWFDVIPLSGARVALVVGDVVGHGIHASATMGRLRTAVRTLADIDLPPDELLTHLDDLVARLATEAEAAENETAGDVGATCLYAVYDPVSRRCALARAGHPPPALVSPDGRVELLDLPAGPPLGLGGLPFESVEFDLPEGSVLALYTDGLLDSRTRRTDPPGEDGTVTGTGAGAGGDDDGDDGVSLLCSSLARPAASLDDLCDTVLGGMLPQRPADDVALLVARTRGLDASRVAIWDVQPDPAAVAETRKNVIACLEAWGLTDAAFVTELIVSELVTNAIRHAEPPVQLRLIHDRALICEVSDASGTAPHMRRARTYDEGGRGLLLVAQLTERWGTRPGTRGGKTIWAEQNVGK
ncbi:SpoIIE family protein phosphatase [Streptomyces sp. SS7]|uniref:SpoIIE family protein phosphatase n=1 Tax=Streptomyces sp. SS7 TaxID=3108485 RepID=UPI0030EEAF27